MKLNTKPMNPKVKSFLKYMFFIITGIFFMFIFTTITLATMVCKSGCGCGISAHAFCMMCHG